MNQDFSNLREQYGEELFGVDNLDANPFQQFDKWFKAVQNKGIKEPNAMIVSTVDANGQPDARVVLLKELIDDGFVFYTNFTSAKGNQLQVNPKVCLTFAWIEAEKQIRIKGVVEKYDEQKAEKYFQSRPKMSQIAAWASPQSKVIESREILETLYQEYDNLFAEQDVLPKPPIWGGYIVKPFTIEFWQGRKNRLHDRIRYTKSDTNWVLERLAP